MGLRACARRARWRGVLGALTVAAVVLAGGGRPVRAQDVGRELEAMRKRQEELAGALDALIQERAEAKAREEHLVQDLALVRRQLADLKARAVLAEKVEETKRLPEWICPAGHVHDAPGAGGACPDCGAAQQEHETVRVFKVARREAIGEKIAAALEDDAKKRVTVAVSGTGVYQQILHNQGSGTENTGHAEGSLDVFLITRPLPYSLFFIDLEAIGGSGPDAEIGSLANLNSDAGRRVPQTEGNDSVNVREAWLRSDLLQDRLHLAAGKIDLSNFFDRNRVANDETSQFLTDAFVNNPVLGTPALNGPGATAWYDTKGALAVGFGVQKPSDEGFRVTQGLFTIGEVDWKTYLLGREGNVRAWGRRDETAPFRSWAAGLSFDQELSSRVSVFARYGWSDLENAADPWAYSSGVKLSAPFESRPRDAWGLAFGQQRGSLGRDEGDRDTVVETYYRFVLNDHFAVTPLFQYLVHTAGDGGELPPQDNVAVLGLRVQIDF